eukprot:4681982-Prorocentrum_lima.AAC.1
MTSSLVGSEMCIRDRIKLTSTMPLYFGDRVLLAMETEEGGERCIEAGVVPVPPFGHCWEREPVGRVEGFRGCTE